MCKKSLLLLFLLPFQFVFAQTSLLTDFPEGYTPKEVGKRLAYHFVDGKHMLHIGKWISYPETFTWNGGLKFAALTNDQELVKLLQNRFELLFTTEKALLPIMNHVDVNMFGSLPLELYKITKDQRYLDLGLPYADTQWQLPAMLAYAAVNSRLVTPSVSSPNPADNLISVLVTPSSSLRASTNVEKRICFR